MGFAAINCSPTAFTASIKAPAWFEYGTRCCEITERSNSAVCFAVACEPSILLHQNAKAQQPYSVNKTQKNTQPRVHNSLNPPLGLKTHRFLSLTRNSLTRACISGIFNTKILPEKTKDQKNHYWLIFDSTNNYETKNK